MNIAHFVSTFPPYRGGMGRVAEEQARVLTELGHSLTVFTPRYASKQQTVPKYPFQVERVRPIFTFGNAAFVPQLARKLDPFDVIHVHYPFYGGAEMLNAAMNTRRATKRYVITYHMDTVGVGAQAIFFSWYKETIMPTIIENAHVVMVSSFDYLIESDLKEIYVKKPELFVEMPLGVDLNRFSPGEKNLALLDQYKITHDEKVVLFVGGLDRAHYFKGVHYLIQAVHSLYQKNMPVKLVIGGSGSLMTTYVQLVKNLEIEKNVIFTGALSDETLPEWYRAADVVVLPSVDKSEAFGVVLLEAMACGRPVIASNLPGVRTLVEEDKNGFLVQPGNIEDLAQKIQTIVSDSNRIKNFGQRGREMAVEKYDWNTIGKRLIMVYENRFSK